MLSEDKEKKLIELFIALDDFCLALYAWQAKQVPIRKVSVHKPVMSDSELLTILVFYQFSGYKCFEYYYHELLAKELYSYFPYQVSYERFVARIPRLLPGLYVFLKWRTLLSQRTGTYFIDSKKLPICDNHRIHQNQVFGQLATRGKSSTGWFFGFKLHLVINQYGEVVNFLFTPANVADNNQQVLLAQLQGLKGKCYGDRGYLTSLFEQFYEQGLHLITKIRSKMKNKLLLLEDKLQLRKRALIESIHDILTSVFDLEHTRHRSPLNAYAHMLAALTAYCFYDHKPAAFVPNTKHLLLA
ncbi:IS982 family transposase (plasmid) [Adhaeribacter swui]|uniref:IS982 family transposase n=1 Tax=Adhaeribacter swui TaxID=2086471 RepID=A0A7G7G2K3_9BACT|nr:IS982 family transposase [Adhaeribacter swui]QNF31387.1 IS982 family transposase [Adhaeribacter swui]